MASAVDICNTTLSLLGQDTIVTAISPPDGSAEAEHFERFYPMARDQLLEMHSWKWATKRMALTPITNPVDHWAFAYSLDTSVLKVLLVLPTESTSDLEGSVDFEVEAQADGSAVLYTNMENAWIKYIAKVTDTSKFSPSFVTALALLLCFYVVGPILKKPELAQSKWKEFIPFYQWARDLDASGRKTLTKNYQPSHLKARGAITQAQDAWIKRP